MTELKEPILSYFHYVTTYPSTTMITLGFKIANNSLPSTCINITLFNQNNYSDVRITVYPFLD